MNRVLGLCVLAALAANCAGRSPRASSSPGPVSPSSLEDYIRATYKVGIENARAEKDVAPEPEPALADLLARSKTNPTDLSVKAELAEFYYQRQQYLQAYNVLMEIHSRFPEEPQTNVKLAHIWDDWQQHELALQHASRALEAGMDTAALYALLGRIHLHLNQPADAIAWYQKSLAKEAGNASVLANLGYAHILRSEWQSARQYLDAALALDSDMPEAHNNLAGVLAQFEDYEGSLRHLLQAAAPPVAMNNMGVLYLQRQRTEDAVRYLREALRLDPTYLTAQRNLQIAQMLEPPPAIIALPSFDKIPAEGSTMLVTPLPTASVAAPWAKPAPTRVEASAAHPAESPAQALSESAADPAVPVADDVVAAADLPSTNSDAAVSRPGPGTFRSRVWTSLQQERAPLQIAGVASLVILTGWLALRARKFWN